MITITEMKGAIRHYGKNVVREMLWPMILEYRQRGDVSFTYGQNGWPIGVSCSYSFKTQPVPDKVVIDDATWDNLEITIVGKKIAGVKGVPYHGIVHVNYEENIKPTDLRVGNLIQYGQYRNDKKMTIGKIVSIYLVTTKYYAVLEDGFTVTIDAGIKPIPLTKEWLVKQGAKESSPEWIVGSECFEFFDEDFVYTAGEGVRLSRPIKFIHDLQNLYYALTGEELTLK